MTDDDLPALRLLLDTDEPRLPLVSAGEARGAVALLAHYGEGDGTAAALVRRWSTNVARRLVAE
ncbi:hypothetical protein ADK76_37945 [Streptomyces griseoflavus]|uniref:hypothetical protein n=1 Tax=Streptomyces rimosus TaxID=1927 RepID=UPI0004CBC011|nr:hypothetical protein [Streptomyces rimosus]KOG51005.1 hypothetical protein ADK76_37945 [Streptomyces griseoflavus]